MLRNWWELAGVSELNRQLFPVGEGSHATPSEVSVTCFGYPEAQKKVEMSPRIAPTGPIFDAEDYRRRFPDGRIGSDPSQASVEAGGKIVAAAVKSVIAEFRQFARSRRDRLRMDGPAISLRRPISYRTGQVQFVASSSGIIVSPSFFWRTTDRQLRSCAIAPTNSSE